MNRWFAGWILLGALGLSGCSSSGGTGGDNCRGGKGDAGTTARALGEPCTDGFACQPPLVCAGLNGPGPDVARQECLVGCGDAGACASGTACVELDGTPGTSCQPTCASSADCPGPFDRYCHGFDGGSGPGVCVVRTCAYDGVTCSSGTHCATRLYCCPPGAPCAAPPTGLCLL